MPLPRRGRKQNRKYRLDETHVPLYQREIQDLLYASSGITNTKRQSSSRNGKRNSHPKAQIISLRPKSAKQSERELEHKYKKKVKYTKKWFDQFAVHIPNNNRNNLQRPKTATPKYKPRTKIFNVPPPPYESAFSGRPMPFRPEFVGNERVNMEDPHYKAKKRQLEDKKPITNAPIFETKKIVYKRSVNRARPSSAPHKRRGNAKKVDIGDDNPFASKKYLKPLSKNKDERATYNPNEIRRRLHDPVTRVKRKEQIPYMTAREAVMLQNGGSVLGNVIDQGNDLEFDDQKHQQPGVFVQGTMTIPPENVGAVTTLARRFCEEMKTKDYNYIGKGGGVNVQLLVQSGQLHRLMSALQSLDTGVSMRLTMKTRKDEANDSIRSSNNTANASSEDEDDYLYDNTTTNGPVVLWNNDSKDKGTYSTGEAAANVLKTLNGGNHRTKHKWKHNYIEGGEDLSHLPGTLRHQMSPEQRAERMEYSRELKDIAQSIPAPCPVSLREVSDDKQKAVLWPVKAAEKKYKEKFPPEHVKKAMQRTKAHEMITSTAFARNLCRAARLGDRKAVAALLSRHKHNKGWVNAKKEDGTIALHHAADTGYLEIVEDLLSQGADISIRAPVHGTPLDLAKKNLKRSIDFNKKKEVRDRCHMIACLLKTTSIHRAAQEGDFTRVKYLYEEHGIDPMVPNKYGMTPLHLAAVGGHALTARYLYKVGGENALHAENNLGQKPIDIANGDVIDILEETHRFEKAQKEYIIKHRKQAEDQLDKDDKKDREAWERVRGTSAALPLKNKILERVVAREHMSPIKYARASKDDQRTRQKFPSQTKGIYADGRSPSKSRYMKIGKDHNTLEIAKRVRKKDMFSDRAFGDRHPAQGSSRLRHVREFCKSDNPRDVLSAFHAYDRRVKKHSTGTPKITDQNFDKWISFHFGAVRG